MRALYLVSKCVCPACAWVVPHAGSTKRDPLCLPRVRMGGSNQPIMRLVDPKSAPRVHGWFQKSDNQNSTTPVCPACAWVVPLHRAGMQVRTRLPRVCMGGSILRCIRKRRKRSAPRVHGWFRSHTGKSVRSRVCPACAWVVPAVSFRVLAPVSLLPPRYR